MQPATVHLVCGLNAAGKSTLARHLAVDLPACHFNLDERLIRRFPGLDHASEDHGAAAAREREDIWREAEEVLAGGTDVVLDWNCWRAADAMCHRLRDDDARGLVTVFECRTAKEGLRVLRYDHGHHARDAAVGPR